MDISVELKKQFFNTLYKATQDRMYEKKAFFARESLMTINIELQS